ncbi:MAG: DNA photolyase family protein [Candidatus Micrarchaeota archaeon]|nr:DNA photolyase family protein [Candidatus Micrarchaeota archaeon]
MHKKSLFIFRRDLRLEDNTGLIAALLESREAVPCFIFDPAQRKGAYFSQNAFQFMCESLSELDSSLRALGSRLFVLEGKPKALVRAVAEEEGIEAVFANRDYTPFAVQRDREISSACRELGIPLYLFSDALLHEPEEVKKPDGTPYTIFTPFFRAASRLAVRKPQKNSGRNYFKGDLRGAVPIPPYRKNPSLALRGGRSAGLKLLARIGKLADYPRKRNIPALDATTHLSAHHKFGTVSIRETYWEIASRLGDAHPLINELYWRDFFTHIAYHFPRVFGKPFNPRYSGLRWKRDRKALGLWKRGKTGFPIVDAGMRQLNTTGFMHNRVRMIAASFLTKDLHIDWREGERYFAQKLVDYDPCVNNGNWQWAASTGCDAQPYFRIFNPWSQQKRFDPDCLYIKKWVPELSSLSAKEIHSLEKRLPPKGYPAPLVNHAREAHISRLIFRRAREGGR